MKKREASEPKYISLGILKCFEQASKSLQVLIQDQATIQIATLRFYYVATRTMLSWYVYQVL